MKYPTALDCYIKATEFVLSESEKSESYFMLLNECFAPLRFLLACRVCNKLLQTPMAPDHTVCQHTVCKACIGGKMKLKPLCGWCKNYENFIYNKQLDSLINCYGHLCQFVFNSAYHNEQIRTLIDAVNSNTNNGHDMLEAHNLAIENKSKAQTILEGGKADLAQRMAGGETIESIPTLNASVSLVSSNEKSSSNEIGESQTDDPKSKSLKLSRKGRKRRRKLNLGQTVEKSSTLTLDQLTTDPNVTSPHQKSRSHPGSPDPPSPKRSFFRQVSAGFDIGKSSFRPTDAALGASSASPASLTSPAMLYSGGKPSLGSIPEHVANSDSTKKKRRSGQKIEKRGCGCGTATANPGKLTCYGQRCPCYSNHNPCLDCRCRGCRNPNKVIKIEQVAEHEAENDVEISII